MIYIKRLSLVFVYLLLASCAIKPPVTSDYDTAYDFSPLKTFAWIESKDLKKVSTLTNKRQITAIETLLLNKGFSKASNKDNADFLLKTHTVTDKKVDVDRFYNTWGYYPFYDGDFFHPAFYGPQHSSTTVVRERKIGTLILDIVDPKKKQVIWRGTVAKPLGIYKNRTPEERMKIVMSNAQYLLETFPPKPISGK